MDEGFPIPSPGGADKAPAGGGAGFPTPTPGGADRPLIPVTSTETSTTTQGLDKSSTAEVRGATEDANEAADASGQAQIGEMKATAGLERQQSRDAFGRGVNNYFQAWGERQVQDEILRETTTRLEQTAKFKPDRTALFKGDNGTLFGISAAIAAMSGGWLMGQGLTGGRNPYLESILQMIQDNAQDQIDSNSVVYQELTRRLGSAEAAKKELTARMLESVNTTIEAQSRFEKAATIEQGAARVMAEIESQKARNRLEAAKLTSKTVATTVQNKTQMIANPAYGGVDVMDPREYARVGKVGGLDRLVTEAAGLAESGALEDNVGLIGGVAAGAANALTFDAFRGPERARVDKLKAQWELMQRADWASEPNGQIVQERLSSIAFPKNASEIPLFLQSTREALNAADPGGRYRQAARAMGQTPQAKETRRIPVVR